MDPKNLYRFFRALFSNPRRMGAIVPSSHHLANEMVSHVVVADDSIVVELGAGTGVVTEALLQRGIKPENIIAIEYSRELARALQRRLPQIKVISGNAVDLLHLLRDEHRRVDTVISSLPLRSMSLLTVRKVIAQIKQLLTVNGRYIQFTYSYKRSRFYSLMDFRRIISKRVWINLPPARVDVWVKN